MGIADILAKTNPTYKDVVRMSQLYNELLDWERKRLSSIIHRLIQELDNRDKR